MRNARHMDATGPAKRAAGQRVQTLPIIRATMIVGQWRS